MANGKFKKEVPESPTKPWHWGFLEPPQPSFIPREVKWGISDFNHFEIKLFQLAYSENVQKMRASASIILTKPIFCRSFCCHHR